jgi:hypothetical protein
VELEVEWSLWSGAEVFGVELSQTAPNKVLKNMVKDPVSNCGPFQHGQKHPAVELTEDNKHTQRRTRSLGLGF